jgi:hypothetical protein
MREIFLEPAPALLDEIVSRAVGMGWTFVFTAPLARRRTWAS